MQRPTRPWLRTQLLEIRICPAPIQSGKPCPGRRWLRISFTVKTGGKIIGVPSAKKFRWIPGGLPGLEARIGDWEQEFLTPVANAFGHEMIY